MIVDGKVEGGFFYDHTMSKDLEEANRKLEETKKALEKTKKELDEEKERKRSPSLFVKDNASGGRGSDGIESFTGGLNFGDSFKELLLGGDAASFFGSDDSVVVQAPAPGDDSFFGTSGSFSDNDNSINNSGFSSPDRFCGGGIGGLLDTFNSVGELATNLIPTNQVIAQQTNVNQQFSDEQRQKQQIMFQQNFLPRQSSSDSTNSKHANNHYYVNNTKTAHGQQLLQQEEHQPTRNDTTTNNNNNNSGNKDINNYSKTDDIESDLSRRVNNLSVTERQQARNDVYGFRLNRTNEDPIQLRSWLNQMDQYIAKGISGNDKVFSALRLAMHSTSSSTSSSSSSSSSTGLNQAEHRSGAAYVKSQRLKFLRAADWQSDEAVNRLARFFEAKLEYFGLESLTRDLTLCDLSTRDLALWEQYGFVQLSEERDAYGRLIVVFITKEQVHLPIETVIRVLIYLSMILTRDETIQKNGSILVCWGYGQEFILSRRATVIASMYRVMPLRGVGRHICYNSSNMRQFLAIIARIAIAWGAVRTRAHHGTMMECAYNLMTYGIPRKAIPVDDDGKVELNFFHLFLDAIKKRENEEGERSQLYFRNDLLRDLPIMEIDEYCESSNIDELTMSETAIDPLSVSCSSLEKLPTDFCSQLAAMKNNNTSSAAATVPSTLTSGDSSGGGSVSSASMMPTIPPKQLREEVKAPYQPSLTGNNNSKKEKATKLKDEAINGSDEMVFVPGPYDVIMGRGRHNKKKPGNRKLSQLLESYAEEYEASDKFQKTVMSEVVVSKMHEDGSRFLVREGDKKQGLWVEVSVDKARDKVAHDFRNIRRNARLEAEKEKNAAATAAVNTTVNPSHYANGLDTNNSSSSSKRRRSVMTSTNHEQARDSKRTQGILEKM